jgi:sugar phosphate permease
MGRLRLTRLYRGWWIVLTGYLSQLAAGGASGWVFGVLILPMQEDLGWSRSTIVGVLTLERLITGGVGFWLGPLVDKYGARLLMTGSALLAGTCLMALAFVQAPWQPYVLWATFGVCMPGLTTLGPIVAISNWFIRRRAQAIMAYTFGGATGGLLLAPAMAALAGDLGWRAAWVAMGLLLWALAPLAWVTIRHHPEDVGLLPDGDTANPRQARVAPETVEEADWTVGQAVRSRSFWLLTLGFMLTMLPASSIFIHMSAYVQSKGFSVEAGAAAVSIYGFGALLGRFVWGFGVARAGLHKALVAYGFLYGLSIFLYTIPSSLFAIYTTTVLLGVAISGSQQLRAQAFPDYFGRRIVGTLLGYAGVVGMLAGAAAPLLVALAYDATGSYTGTFVAFGTCCIAASVGFLFSRPRVEDRIHVAQSATPGG